MAMRKENTVKAGLTGCDFCNKKSVKVDDDGTTRCKKHLKREGNMKLASAAPAASSNS